MKICTICNIEKTLDLFPNLNRSADGKYSQCKECKKIIDREYYNRKKHKIQERTLNYYKINKDRVLEKRNKDELKLYNKEYKQRNKEQIKEYNRNYRLINKDSIKKQRQEYRINNKTKINEYNRNRLNNDPLYKLARKLRNRLLDFLKNNGKQFGKRSSEVYLGCSLEELKIHLESKFQPEMTWENHGEIWHIDHILPLSSAKTEEQLYQLCHWTNLQPLSKQQNLSKNGKLPQNICWQKLQRDRLLAEDIKNGFPTNLKASDFTLSQEPITSEHRKFIERYEWLGTCGFGVRYVFTARYNGLLGGVVMLAEPNSYQFDKKLEALIQRGACASWTPKNLGSRLIMFACRWMINNTNKRIFTAYSDPEAGEIGTIYQACNFDYLGQNYGSDYYIQLENGKLVSERHFTRTSSMKKWAKELNIEWKEEWTKSNGFQDRNQIPMEIKKQLDEYAKKQYELLPKIKKAKKGKYALLLNHSREQYIKPWNPAPYPKRSF